jgi:hypothetical protein
MPVHDYNRHAKTAYLRVGETIVDNQGSEDCKPSGNQGWLRSINKNFGHPSELM